VLRFRERPETPQDSILKNPGIHVYQNTKNALKIDAGQFSGENSFLAGLTSRGGGVLVASRSVRGFVIVG
jgi:hypothetical protein